MNNLDLLSEDFRLNQQKTFAEALEKCPVAQSPAGDYYIVSKYDDIVECVRNPALWSSKHGPGLIREPEDAPGALVNADPPKHTSQVKIVRQAFATSYLRAQEGSIREFSRELIQGFRHKGRVELHSAYAEPIPLFVISRLLGIPFDGMADYRRWALNAARAVLCDPGDMATLTAAKQAKDEMAAFFVPRVQEWADKLENGEAEPGDNLITRLISAEEDGERLEMPQILAFCNFLLIAGSATTSILITNLVKLLLQNPDQLQQLRQDRSLISNAVEESLRYEAPVHGLFRTNNAETSLRGVTIPAESKVMMAWGAGNLDPDFVDDPLRFDITRDAKLLRRHLAFGHGIHVCLGAALARLEGQVAVEELFDAIPDMRIIGTPERDHTAVLSRPNELWLEWDI